VTKTLIDVDEERLAEARALLGAATTKKGAVNQALGELVRLAALRTFMEVARPGDQEPPGLVLVDASVLVECGRPPVVARLLPLLVLNQAATCAAVKHELAAVADNPVIAALREVALRWLPTDDTDLARASEIQAQLSEQGEQQLLWSRLVVAAVAERHSALVLHCTSDYGPIAKVTSQATEWVVPPSTLPVRPSVPSPGQ
jgi:predicted nucleic acid-binding protein